MAESGTTVFGGASLDEYDSCGRLVFEMSKLPYEAASSLELDFDSGGLLEQELWNDGSCILIAYALDSTGRVIASVDSQECGITEVYRYDGDRVARIDFVEADSGTLLRAMNYAYYPNGNLGSAVETGPKGETRSQKTWDDAGYPLSEVYQAPPYDYANDEWKWDADHHLLFHSTSTDISHSSQGQDYDSGVLVRAWESDQDTGIFFQETLFSYPSPNVQLGIERDETRTVVGLVRTTFDDAGRPLKIEVAPPDGGFTLSGTCSYTCNPPPPM